MENKTVDYSKLKTFTLQQTGEFLQLSVKTIKRHIRQGKFAPVIKIGGKDRVIAEDFYIWLDEVKEKTRAIYTPVNTRSRRRGKIYEKNY